jgi:hypothetical protein
LKGHFEFWSFVTFFFRPRPSQEEKDMKITQYLMVMIAFCASSSYAQPGSPSKVPVTDQ